MNGLEDVQYLFSYIVEDHEHIVQLSMSSSVYAGGGSGKMDSLAELIMILSE